MTGSGPVRIGCGAGFSADRIEPARDLVERGELDYLFCECLAERTLALAQSARARQAAAGFDPYLERRLEALLPACRAAGTRLVSNMGSANPAGAGEAAVALARRLGLRGLRVAVVEGDDVTRFLAPDLPLMEGGTLAEVGLPLVGANAYLGADLIARALAQDADLVITGRCADPSLVVGPLVHAFGWRLDDWARLGAGTLVGHLLECSFQITGGYFADPGHKEVPDLAWLGYPFAEVAEDGSAVIGKLPGTGGLVSRETVLEQMLYEVHDPAAYLTPDVAADFSGVTIAEVGPDRVAVSGATGRRRPERYKATIGFDGGFLAEAEMSYAGPGAAARARLAGAVLRTRMVEQHGCQDPIRIDLVGLSALHATATSAEPGEEDARDVRLRLALRTRSRSLADSLVQEMEAMWIAGPAGGGGMRGRVTPSVVTRSALIERERVEARITVLTA